MRLQFIICHKKELRSSLSSIKLRGGVEDTRLEAKAKDTKKSQAKDSLSEDRHSRGQGPRTQLQVFSKKKVFKKVFQAVSNL